MSIILLSKLSRYLSFTIGLDRWSSGASKISQEFEPKDNKQVVLNIEVTVVTWSSPIAKKCILEANFIVFPDRFHVQNGSYFKKEGF